MRAPAADPPRILLALAGAYALAGLAYLLAKSLFNADPEIDLKYIWVAGRLWGEGINPYSDAFARMGNAFFQDTNRLATWLYPPNWWPIARGLSLFDIGTATFLWRGLNAALLLGGVWLVVQGPGAGSRRLSTLAGLVLVGYAATMQATAMTLSMGQTSILIFFGLCALFSGLAGGRPLWVVIGLVCVALKPNVGIVVWAGVLALPGQFRAVAMALLVTLVLSVPGILAGGARESVAGLIAAYLDYEGALVNNAPPATTGLRHLADAILGVDVPAMAIAVAGATLAWAGARAIAGSASVTDPRDAARDAAFWIVLVVLNFVPLHSYDFVLSLPLALICFGTGYPAHLRIGIAAGLLLIYRSANLAGLTGFHDPGSLSMPGSRLESWAALVMFGLFCIHAFLPRPGAARPRPGR